MALLNYTLAGILGAMVALAIVDAQLSLGQNLPAPLIPGGSSAVVTPA